MTYEAPILEKLNAPTTARCGHCNQVVRVGETVLQYVSSTYRGATHWRKIHFRCLIEKSNLGLGDVMTMATVPPEVTA